MNSLEKAMYFLRQFNSFHFGIKWNIFVFLYALYAFTFGGMGIVSIAMIFLVANLYALPIYILIMRQINVRSDLLMIAAGIVLLIGIFTSFYIPIIVWVGVMVFLFKKKIMQVFNLIKNRT